MPGYRAHMVGGAVAFGCVTYALSHHVSIDVVTMAGWFVAAILGSLFPDIDTKSKGQGLFYKGMLVCLILLLWVHEIHLFILMSFVALMPLLVRHRGLFHQVWFVIAVPFAVAYAVGSSFALPHKDFLLIALFFAVGALSHIVLDRLF